MWQYRFELPKLCYHPGWRLMRTEYHTCFHTLYDENIFRKLYKRRRRKKSYNRKLTNKRGILDKIEKLIIVFKGKSLADEVINILYKQDIFKRESSWGFQTRRQWFEFKDLGLLWAVLVGEEKCCRCFLWSVTYESDSVFMTQGNPFTSFSRFRWPTIGKETLRFGNNGVAMCYI